MQICRQTQMLLHAYSAATSLAVWQVREESPKLTLSAHMQGPVSEPDCPLGIIDPGKEEGIESHLGKDCRLLPRVAKGINLPANARKATRP